MQTGASCSLQRDSYYSAPASVTTQDLRLIVGPFISEGRMVIVDVFLEKSNICLCVKSDDDQSKNFQYGTRQYFKG